MLLTPDHRHPRIMVRAIRMQQRATKAPSMVCGEIKHTVTALSWCLSIQLSAADRDFVVPAVRAELAPGLNHPYSEQVFLTQTSLATNYDVFISFYPYAAHNNWSLPSLLLFFLWRKILTLTRPRFLNIFFCILFFLFFSTSLSSTQRYPDPYSCGGFDILS